MATSRILPARPWWGEISPLEEAKSVVRPGWRWLDLVSQFVSDWGQQGLRGLNKQPQVAQGSMNYTASILFTDIAGFSARMTARPQAEVVADLDHYFQILSACVRQYNGQVDKFIGDGMMAIFDTPDDAVHAARAIQDQVVRFNANQLARQRCLFPTRLAVDTGPVIVTHLRACPHQDKTVFGRVVNLAAHLVQQALPGRILISKRTRDELKNDEVNLRKQQVIIKGQPEPTIVYEM